MRALAEGCLEGRIGRAGGRRRRKRGGGEVSVE